MNAKYRLPVLLLVLVALTAGGCGGGMRPTKFTNTDYNFAYLERVAILPLLNMSEDRQAGSRATRILITELLSTGAVDVVEPGETRAALNKITSGDPTPTTEQVIALGKALNVQAILHGSVAQSGSSRAGTVMIPVVTLDVHLLEAESGQVIWAATHTEKGGSAGAALLGTGSEPISQTTRRCARRLVKTLVN
jgi:TolB-like protein